MNDRAIQTTSPSWQKNECLLKTALKNQDLLATWQGLCTSEELAALSQQHSISSSEGLIILKPDFIARRLGAVIFPFMFRICGLKITSARRVELSETSVRFFWPTILSLDAWIESVACFVNKPLIQLKIHDATGCAIKKALVLKRILRRILCDEPNPASRLIHTSDSVNEMARENQILASGTSTTTLFTKIAVLRGLTQDLQSLDVGAGFIFFAEQPQPKEPKLLCVMTEKDPPDLENKLAVVRVMYPDLKIYCHNLKDGVPKVSGLFDYALFIKGNPEAFLKHRSAFIKEFN